ncbi:MAG: hypothetical protein JWP86_724 [Phenylobacterium sp.]|nr:hypothetical protein [Phenylobacterium sp.]
MSLVGRRPSRNTFRAALRAGVWSVTKDGQFYGDYMSRDQAIRGACNGARAVEATGSQAKVLVGSDEEVIAHRDLLLEP